MRRNGDPMKRPTSSSSPDRKSARGRRMPALRPAFRLARRLWPLLVVVLLLSFATGVAFAAPGDSGSPAISIAPVNPEFTAYMAGKTDRGPLKTIDGHGLGLVPGPQPVLLGSGAKGGIERTPPQYDLRTLGRVTSAKNQGGWGTCWAFASCGSLESNLLRIPETWDFSENNMANNHGFNLGFDDGGNLWMATAYLTRWGGPVLESEDPYDSLKRTGIAPRKHVQEVIVLPPRSEALDNAAVKEAVMDYGAVYVSMRADMSSSYYNSLTKSYYYNEVQGTNHGVLIVGWDDGYDRSKFSNNPGADGAFIVKNSWGTNWGDGGYFYVSYYDSKFGRTGNMAAFSTAEPVDNYSGIYQYDPLGAVGQFGYKEPTAWFANVFTAQADESLKAVGFYTEAANTTYEVYTGSRLGDLTDATPNTGGTLPHMDNHPVSLDSPVALTNGEEFFVAVKVTSPGETHPIACEYPRPEYSEDATASPGQSYYSYSGTTWDDMTDFEANANVCLKAYVTEQTPPSTYTLTTSTTGSGIVTLTPDKVEYSEGETVSLSAVPAQGWGFVSWSGDLSGRTNPQTVVMNKDTTVVAHFSDTPIQLQAGWNLVAAAAGTIFDGALFGWTGSAYLSATDPTAWQGYWLRSSTAQTDYLITATGPHTITLTEGWNLVGNPMRATATLTLPEGSMAFTYDALAGIYSSTTSLLQPGQGAWVRAHAGDTLVLTPLD